MKTQKISVIEEFKTASAAIILRSDNIINIHIITDEELSLAQLKESNMLHAKICKGKKYPNLVTFKHDYVPFSKEAREYAAGEESNKYSICDAIVIKSTAMRLFAKAYITINKPLIPTAIFDTEEKAVAWIKKIINQK